MLQQGMKTMHRQHTSGRRSALGRFGLVLGALALATGCQSMEKADAWIEKKIQPPTSMASADETAISVRRDTISQAIGFAPRSAALGSAERDMLSRFVARSGATSGDRAVISLSVAGGRALAERRVAAIARELHRGGLRVARSLGPGEPDLAVVSINRTVAVAPDCPQWRTFVAKGHVDENNGKLGCMTAASLATSVHRPQDLVSGRPLGPSDAPTLDRGLQNLREGKFDPTYSSAGTGSPQAGTGTSATK